MTNYRGNFESLRCHNLPSKIAVLSILTQFRLISSLRSGGGGPSNIDTDTADQLSQALTFPGIIITFLSPVKMTSQSLLEK